MAYATASRALQIALKRRCNITFPPPSTTGCCVASSLRQCRQQPIKRTQHQQQQQQVRAIHLTRVVFSDQERGGKGTSSEGGEEDGAVDMQEKSSKLSMTDEDKPDFFDLADLIMSGMSYKDAVRGTDFDDLDADADTQIEEAKRRMALLREDSLEEYLLEKGEADLVNEANAVEIKRRKRLEKMEVNKPAPAPEHVEMAQGDWAELLVHSDRVQKTVKGGMEVSYRALVVVGNLNGVGGFAMGKANNPADAVIEASRKAKLPRNLVYVQRYKQACLYMDVLGKHNGCKTYVWARQPGYGMRASPLLRSILYNMGITDAGCKVVGNRNRYSMVYALFKGLAKHRGLEETAQTRGKRILTLHRGHEIFAR